MYGGVPSDVWGCSVRHMGGAPSDIWSVWGMLHQMYGRCFIRCMGVLYLMYGGFHQLYGRCFIGCMGVLHWMYGGCSVRHLEGALSEVWECSIRWTRVLHQTYGAAPIRAMEGALSESWDAPLGGEGRNRPPQLALPGQGPWLVAALYCVLHSPSCSPAQLGALPVVTALLYWELCLLSLLCPLSLLPPKSPIAAAADEPHVE